MATDSGPSLCVFFVFVSILNPCYSQLCNNVTAPVGGKVTCTEDNTLLVCTAVCNKGYEFSTFTQVERRYCVQTTGQWVNGNKLPSCIPYVKNMCSSIEPPNQGVVRCENTNSQLVCNAKCNTGYMFESQELEVERTCDISNHLWINGREFPDCIRNDTRCSSPVAPTNGLVNCDRNTSTVHCVALCKSGYEFSTGDIFIERSCDLYNGSWNGVNVEYPKCVLKKTQSVGKCTSLPTQQHTSITCKHNGIDLICSALCDKGYVFETNDVSVVRVCDDATGMWLNGRQVPNCVPATTTTTPPLPQRSDISCNADSIDTFVPISMLPSGAPLTWRDPTCSVTSNGTHMISSIGLSQCGTTVTITKDNVEFENELKAQSTNSTANSLIDFGEDAYVIPVKCIYPRTETPMTSYVPLQQHVRFYEKRYGHFDVDIMQYDSDKFSSAIQNLGTPRKVALNSEIYVEVKLNDQFNNGLGIHIDKCIATPTSSPSDSTLYTLLTDGCPASQHVHLYNSPANKVRFGVRAFQFTSQTGAMVYIHCQTSMCQAGSPYCTSNCVTAGRRKRDVAPDQKSHLVSAGPFVLVADEQGTPIRMSTIVASVSAFVAVVACVVAIVGWTRKTRTTSTKEQGLL